MKSILKTIKKYNAVFQTLDYIHIIIISWVLSLTVGLFLNKHFPAVGEALAGFLGLK